MKKITEFDPHLMEAPQAEVVISHSTLSQEIFKQHYDSDHFESTRSVDNYRLQRTIQAAKLVTELPASVIESALDVTRRRMEIDQIQRTKQTRRVIGSSKIAPDANISPGRFKSELQRFLTTTAPRPWVLDEWVHIDQPFWPYAESYRLSVAIVLCGEHILSDPEKRLWSHLEDCAFPLLTHEETEIGRKLRFPTFEGDTPIIFLENPPPAEHKNRFKPWMLHAKRTARKQQPHTFKREDRFDEIRNLGINELSTHHEDAEYANFLHNLFAKPSDQNQPTQQSINDDATFDSDDLFSDLDSLLKKSVKIDQEGEQHEDSQDE